MYLLKFEKHLARDTGFHRLLVVQSLVSHLLCSYFSFLLPCHLPDWFWTSYSVSPFSCLENRGTNNTYLTLLWVLNDVIVKRRMDYRSVVVCRKKMHAVIFFIVSLMYCIILPLPHGKWDNTLISELPIPIDRYVLCMFSILWVSTNLFSQVIPM